MEKRPQDNEKTWDTIAQSFNTTRNKPWKQCIDFIQQLPDTYTIADLGCGNGRHLLPCAEHCKKAIGLDISKKLLNITKNKIKKQHLNNTELIHADITQLPLKENTMDAIVFIAALHNIRGRKKRIQSLKEVNRILKKNGRALISVWSRWQDRYRKHFIKKMLFNKKKHGREEFGDIYIYWRQHSLNIPRYYHLYSKKEFIRDIKQSGLEIENIQSVKIHSKIFPDNYFAITKKKR
ncbi:MAG: class I SAM-dependent methyltransferase [Thermoplasmata archaeon]|nr:MAG: class I SAM-dependent methyltransferase [Thermoplasmata archaeon]